VSLLAKAAKGSLRDSLSLLEQAIAIGEGKVTLQPVSDMLGLYHQTFMHPLIEALANKNTQALFQVTAKLAQSGADFSNTLEAMLDCLQALSMMQMVPDAKTHISYLNSVDDTILALHQQFTPEMVQLYYQIALLGKKDLPLVSDSQRGFEMLLLRMLSFQPFELPITHEAPAAIKVEAPVTSVAPIKTTTQPAVTPMSTTAPIPGGTPTGLEPVDIIQKPKPKIQKPNVADGSTPSWATLCKDLPIIGLVKVLAQNCVIAKWALPEIELTLEASQEACLNDDRRRKIETAVSE